MVGRNWDDARELFRTPLRGDLPAPFRRRLLSRASRRPARDPVRRTSRPTRVRFNVQCMGV